ncbi:MAG: hypothetical protein U5R31_10585 [Acidimicrobiia bacterium]|nr:hypothetical protein [Acidimicrobiia bacterium]
MVRVGIIGGSGFTGAELLRLLAAHPALEPVVVTADTQAGVPVRELYPSLAPTYGDLRFVAVDEVAFDDLDLAFFALPHGASQTLVPDVRGTVAHVVDLAADFRLKDAGLYPTWYGEEHHAPELLAEFVYGLPERHRDELVGARAVAVPGCYPTAATLPLAPLLDAGAVEPDGVVVDAASGASARGDPRSPTRPSVRWTRTSRPTACSLIATPPRSNRTSVGGCSSRPTWSP